MHYCSKVWGLYFSFKVSYAAVVYILVYTLLSQIAMQYVIKLHTVGLYSISEKKQNRSISLIFSIVLTSQLTLKVQASTLLVFNFWHLL